MPGQVEVALKKIPMLRLNHSLNPQMSPCPLTESRASNDQGSNIQELKPIHILHQHFILMPFRFSSSRCSNITCTPTNRPAHATPKNTMPCQLPTIPAIKPFNPSIPTANPTRLA